MNRTLLFLSVSLTLLFSYSGFSQSALNPVKWEYSYESLNNKEGFVVIKATIEKDWHVYSQNLVADGPIPTSFVFSANPDFEPVEKTVEPPAEKVYSEVFGAEVTSFSTEVIFKQKIKRKNLNAFDLNAELEFMACNNSMCLPPKIIKFSVKIPATSVK